MKGVFGMTESAWWRPDALARRRPYLEARGRIVNAMREVFASHGFTEVETPALQVSPGLEPHLKAFATMLERPGEGPAPRFLHTSPEFAMKKLLVAGMTRIFQLAHCFRNARARRDAFAGILDARMVSRGRGLSRSRRGLRGAAARDRRAADDLAGDGSAIRMRAWERLTVAEAFAAIAASTFWRRVEDRDALAAAAQPLGHRAA